MAILHYMGAGLGTSKQSEAIEASIIKFYNIQLRLYFINVDLRLSCNITTVMTSHYLQSPRHCVLQNTPCSTLQPGNSINHHFVWSRSESYCDRVPARRWKTRRETFEALRLYCSNNLSNIPLTFMLGFYVSLVVDRWWKQYQLLPWPDSFGIMVTGSGGQHRGTDRALFQT